MTTNLYSAGLTFARCAFTGAHAGPSGLPMVTNIYSGICFIGSPVKRVSVLLGHFIWNGITSERMCTKLHRLIGSNIRYIGPVNSEPRVDTSQRSKRTNLSLAKKIALLDDELHAVFHRPVVSLCAVKDTSQRFLECLHVSCSARFQDESVLTQLCLGNRVRPVPNQAKCRLIASARF